MPNTIPLDYLNDLLEETIFKSRHGLKLKEITPYTNFNEREVEALALIHHAIEKARGPVNRTAFRDVAHSGFDFTENLRHLLIDRIYSQIDRRNTLKLPKIEFVEGMSTILKGDLQEKTSFAYKVYDLMKSNKLTKEQIFPMLRGCLIKMQSEENPDENTQDMVELLVKAIDIDRDGEVSAEEFMTACELKNTLFMECAGPVYPSREAVYAFLTTFTDRLDKF